MAMKQSGQHTHRTARGKMIDMDMLRKKNELVPAVGNARVNARGDELGPGGRIIRKREDIVNEYYKNTNSVPSESSPRTVAEPEAAPAKKPTTKKTAKKIQSKEPVGETPSAEEAAEWEEDEEGNFTKKGE